MARKPRKSKKDKRPDASYIETARRLAPIVPKLKKYKRRKTLTRWEKTAITKRERKLKNIPFLFPITKEQGKRLKKGKKFLPWVNAIQLRGVPEGTKFRVDKKGDISITEPPAPDGRKRRWIYWALEREIVRSKRGMKSAGKKAFDKTFPIEKIADLAALAFKRMDVKEVRLWAHAGIVGDSFEQLGAFVRWVNEKWSAGRYMGEQIRNSGDIYSNPSDPGKWVNGIAILLEDAAYTKRRKSIK